MTTEFKTYEQLMKHYWGVIVPMAEAEGINPWECVRISNISTTLHTYHPDFTLDPGRYTFALTVLEGKPVFVGDKLYNKLDGRIIDWDFYPSESFEHWSWTQPTKKRTFMLGDKELPCPARNSETPHWICKKGIQHIFGTGMIAEK